MGRFLPVPLHEVKMGALANIHELQQFLLFKNSLKYATLNVFELRFC